MAAAAAKRREEREEMEVAFNFLKNDDHTDRLLRVLRAQEADIQPGVPVPSFMNNLNVFLRAAGADEDRGKDTAKRLEWFRKSKHEFNDDFLKRPAVEDCLLGFARTRAFKSEFAFAAPSVPKALHIF